MEYLFLIVGFVLLILGGNYLVKGASNIALRFNISKLIVGVVIVSIGTSLPELFVSVGAGLKGSSDIALSNVIGSNIANIALVLALTAIVFPIPVKSDSTLIDWPVMFFGTMILYFFMRDGVISEVNGIVFLLMFIAYVTFLVNRERRRMNGYVRGEEIEAPSVSLMLSVVFVLGSCISLYYGANLLVDNACIIAAEMGVSQRIIGLTIIAFGTSVPELATSLVAAYKKEMDISVGNIIGSNIFNIFLVMGTTATVKPIMVAPQMNNYDIFWLLGISTLLLLCILPARNGKVTRWKGVALFSSYFLYLFFLKK